MTSATRSSQMPPTRSPSATWAICRTLRTRISRWICSGDFPTRISLKSDCRSCGGKGKKKADADSDQAVDRRVFLFSNVIVGSTHSREPHHNALVCAVTARTFPETMHWKCRIEKPLLADWPRHSERTMATSSSVQQASTSDGSATAAEPSNVLPSTVLASRGARAPTAGALSSCFSISVSRPARAAVSSRMRSDVRLAIASRLLLPSPFGSICGHCIYAMRRVQARSFPGSCKMLTSCAR